MNTLLGMKKCGYFLGPLQNWTIFVCVGVGGAFLYILGLFLKVKVQNGNTILGVAKISNIFWVCLIFLMFLWGGGGGGGA